MGMITDADTYFIDGCGRCELFATHSCKARIWSEPLSVLRETLLFGSWGEAKWGQPTYTLAGKNVAMLFSFKDCCGISFFKGVLIPGRSQFIGPSRT